jgi:molybdopterin-guanine dinucleotide biosynthesis protein A
MKLPITIAILLGGESSRFGSPKAFLPWKNTSLAAHLAQTAGLLASEVLFVGKSESQVPENAKSLAKFVADEPGFPGPLAGFAAALTQASKPWVFLTGVDMPYLNEKVLKEFWNLREKSVLLNAIVPYMDNHWQPLCGLWNRYSLNFFKASSWGSFQQFLNEGGLKITKLEENTLRSWDPDLLCLKGFNTKEEWAKLNLFAADEHR